MISSIFDDPAVSRIGWTLLHFLWQGAAIALALKGALMVVEHSSSRLRYALALVSLFLMAALPVFVLCKPQRSQPEISAASETILFETAAATESITPAIPILGKPDFRDMAQRYAAPLVPWIAACWFLGMALLLMKTLRGIIQVGRLRRNASAYRETKGIDEFRLLAARAKVNAAPVLETNLVSTPTVAGWLNPVVLLPKGVYANIDRSMLDALVAHEFAHIRRRDSVINLFQTVIENIFFFHPAMWWVSGNVRAEREACCDDDAVATCGDTLIYVRALSRAEQFRSSMPVIALSSTPLLQRIRRLTEMKISKSSHATVIGIGLLAILFIIATAAGSVLLATIPPQDSYSSVSANTQSGDKGSDQSKPETQGANTTSQEVKKSAKPKNSTPPHKGAKGNLVGGIPGGVNGGTAGGVPGGVVGGILKGKGTVPPPPKPSSQKVDQGSIVGGIPGGVAGGVDGGKSGGVPGGIVGGLLSSSGPVAPPPPPKPVKREPVGADGKVAVVSPEAFQEMSREANESKLIRAVAPIYPESAIKSHVSGKVILRVNVNEQGNVTDAKVLKGHPLLNDAAITAVTQWKYIPTLLNGKPVPIIATVTINFNLDKDGKPRVGSDF